MNLSHILIKPVLTEKTVQGTEAGKYTFLISEDSSKMDVKRALKTLYGAEVVKVNIVKSLPKYKLGKNRRMLEKRGNSKRAIVTLKKGQKLDLTKPKATK